MSKVVSLGRRNATVPEGYSIDQKAEEESGRLEQHVVGTEIFLLLILKHYFIKPTLASYNCRAINYVTKYYMDYYYHWIMQFESFHWLSHHGL